MTVKVFLKNTEIPEHLVDGVSIIADLTEMYLAGEIVLKDMGSHYANSVKLGTPLQIRYITDGGYTYKNDFRIQTFQKIQDRENNDIDFLKMCVVSAWYFDGEPQTRAYKGSYGQWVSLLTQGLSSQLTLGGFNTEDTPKTRYMIAKRPQEFLQETMRYGLIGGMPVYLHTLPTNKLCLDGIANLIKNTNPDTVLFSRNVLQTQAADQVVTELRPNLVSLDPGKRNIRMESFDLHTSNVGNSSKVTCRFTQDHFKCSNTSFASTGIVVQSIEKGNAQVEKVAPARMEYFTWEYTPDDAKAMAVRTGLERVFQTFSLSASLYGTYVDTLYPGAMVEVLLTNNAKGEELVGNGVYMVKRAAYQMRKGKQETKLLLVQASN